MRSVLVIPDPSNLSYIVGRERTSEVNISDLIEQPKGEIPISGKIEISRKFPKVSKFLGLGETKLKEVRESIEYPKGVVWAFLPKSQRSLFPNEVITSSEKIKNKEVPHRHHTSDADDKFFEKYSNYKEILFLRGSGDAPYKGGFHSILCSSEFEARKLIMEWSKEISYIDPKTPDILKCYSSLHLCSKEGKDNLTYVSLTLPEYKELKTQLLKSSPGIKLER